MGFGTEIIFLVVLTGVWMIFATVQDLKNKEIANWLNFSLVIFALGSRFFYSLFTESFGFFYQGLIGLGIFFVAGNILYYGRFFAGGDAKLMIVLGAILPFTENFSVNLRIFGLFFIIFLFVGAVYSLLSSVFLSIKNFRDFKKEFGNQMKKHKNMIHIIFGIGLIIMIAGFLESLFFILGAIVFLIPYLFVYAKAVDESCMVRKVDTKKLTEGDWLYKDVKIGNKKIKASWHGLGKQDIKLLREKHKKVIVRQGVAFSPVFLVSFLILIWFWKTGLWNSFW